VVPVRGAPSQLQGIYASKFMYTLPG